jgi:hypothetical protein
VNVGIPIFALVESTACDSAADKSRALHMRWDVAGTVETIALGRGAAGRQRFGALPRGRIGPRTRALQVLGQGLRTCPIWP